MEHVSQVVRFPNVTPENSENITKPSPSSREQDDTRRLRIIAAMMQTLQKARGFALLEPELALMESRYWLPVVHNIPTDDLWPGFELALAAWDGRSEFGSASVRAGYDLLLKQRQRERDLVEHRRLREQLAVTHCEFCQDHGYQFVRHSNGFTSARPCVCDKAPAGQRSETPLTAADGWQFDERRMEWHRAA